MKKIIVLALVFFNLSKMMPKIGGPYAYAREGFGNFPGFLVAWSYWISILCGNAAISIALVSYLAMFIPSLASNSLFAVIAALLNIWILTFVNIFGVRESGRVQLVTTILKIAPLIAIVLFGIFYLDPNNFIPMNRSSETSFDAIAATTVLTLWAFLGLESATIPAENIKNPDKIIPRATIVGTIITAIIYIISTIAVMGIISPEILVNSNAPFADAARKIWGSAAGYIVAAGGVVACFGALNGWILLQGQIPLAAAKDNLFPKLFSKLSKNSTPVFGLVISSIIVTLLMMMNYTKGLVEQFTFIILLATLVTLVPYLISTLSEILIFSKKREGESRTKYKISVVIALLAFLFSAWAVWGLGYEIIVWGIVLISSGIPVYFLITHNRKHSYIITYFSSVSIPIY